MLSTDILSALASFAPHVAKDANFPFRGHNVSVTGFLLTDRQTTPNRLEYARNCGSQMCNVVAMLQFNPQSNFGAFMTRTRSVPSVNASYSSIFLASSVRPQSALASGIIFQPVPLIVHLTPNTPSVYGSPDWQRTRFFCQVLRRSARSSAIPKAAHEKMPAAESLLMI